MCKGRHAETPSGPSVAVLPVRKTVEHAHGRQDHLPQDQEVLDGFPFLGSTPRVASGGLHGAHDHALPKGQEDDGLDDEEL